MARRYSHGWVLAVAIVALLSEARAELPRVRSLHLNFRCEVGALPPGAKVVDLWVPVPPSDERQTITLLNQSELAGGRFTRDKTFGNELYYRRFDVSRAKESPKVELVYDIDVQEFSVAAAKQLIATSAEVPGPEFAPYLRETSMIPIKGRIADLARTIDLPDGEPLRAGRAIYDHLVDTMVYNYLAPGAGKGDAVWACDSKTGDCTDFHSVFIGICRWRGMPADHVFGLPLPPEKHEGDAKHCHCWARYWVPQVGWIPIDASRASKFPQDKQYYFGTLGSTWVTLAHGRDVVLEPPQRGAPLNMLHGPVAEVDGQPHAAIKWIAHYKDRQPAGTK
jgi:transglutaminase-like putative cysteine protease